MKLFVQALAVVAFTAISSCVQGQLGILPIQKSTYHGVEPVTSDESNLFPGMTITAVWAAGTPERVNSVGVYYIDKEGKEGVFHHGVTIPKEESMILGKGEFVKTFVCQVYESTINYVALITNMYNQTSAGTTQSGFLAGERQSDDYQIGGFASNQEDGKLTGLGAFWICKYPQKCSGNVPEE